MKQYPVIIIGGGQAGLSAAYFLKRKKIDFLVLDAHEQPGGAWQTTWQSLHLFSPADYSSLSGWPLPTTEKEYPSKDEFIDYLRRYEERYQFPVERGVRVELVERSGEGFQLSTNKGTFTAKAVVMATGTATGAYIPDYPGARSFRGRQLHSVNYQGVDSFAGEKVLVVGAGNTGAQVFAELTEVSEAVWTSNRLPHYLPDHIDGRYLFDAATQRYLGMESGLLDKVCNSKKDFANVVMVESVRKARDRGVLTARMADFRLVEDGVIWGDGQHQMFDSVIWATGFRPDLSMLEPLGIVNEGEVKTEETRAIGIDGVWLVGLGDWTGYASATIYGVGKTTATMAEEVASYLLT